MPRASQAADVQGSRYGRTATEVAKEIGIHPSTLIRWIRKPKTLRSGARVQLAATCTPGGYLIKPEDLAAYLEAITRDRLGEADAAPPSRTPSTRSRALARADRELAEAGI